MPDPPLVSVVVTTRDAAATLPACLDAVRSQTHPRVEVLVVDARSTDDSVGVALARGARVVVKDCQRSEGRNLGARMAAGKYVFFLDADMLLSPGVLAECVREAEARDGAFAAYVPERILGRGLLGRVRDFERGFYDATVIDAVRFVPRDAFLEIGGFDEAFFAGEDWDLDRRVRARMPVGLVSSPLWHDERDVGLRAYLAKKAAYSGDLHHYAAKWGPDDPVVRRQLGAAYRLFGVFVEGGKWRRLLRRPHLAAAMGLLRAAVGAQHAWRLRRRVYGGSRGSPPT